MRTWRNSCGKRKQEIKTEHMRIDLSTDGAYKRFTAKEIEKKKNKRFD